MANEDKVLPGSFLEDNPLFQLSIIHILPSVCLQRIIVYPDYINAVKTVAQGRRIPKDKGTARQAGKLEARESDPLLNQICRLRQARSAPREGSILGSFGVFLWAKTVARSFDHTRVQHGLLWNAAVVLSAVADSLL